MPSDGRVAVYIDFDNIVISRYNQIHGNGQFSKDKARTHNSARTTTSAVGVRLLEAEVDVEAILDYASSFGTVAFSRAYADWSVPVNASYHKQLVNRAVVLVQLFPLTALMKNGADIRLAVDAMEDMFRLPDITHVVIVAGDSDYVALAQRAKTLGRFVVGVGVAGGTSDALTSSCDKFADYDSLPGVQYKTPSAQPHPAVSAQATPSARASQALTPAAPSVKKVVNVAKKAAITKVVKTAPAQKSASSTNKPATKASLPKAAPTKQAATVSQSTNPSTADTPAIGMRPFKMLVRAMRLVQQKEDSEWLNSSAVKNQMLRIDPSFNEAALNFKTFRKFVDSHSSNVEVRDREGSQELRLRANATQPK
ncbi:NYN domain-containing protein [Salinibacterium sp. SWN248]|uniref:NYN domain-containing protein n=1 Tax=Salinibacterium sp. SWN248 TaxID=2792056 RepID=UPI001E4C51C9|nr:NYN domain-containing protein [Salinibacterium sp. SWN248]